MKWLIALTSALALAACKPQETSTTAPAAAPVVAASPAAPPVKIPPRGEDERGDDVSVANVVALGEGGAKLFSTVGGDPAINGEYLFLAVLPDEGPMEEPKVYKLGDFNSWSLETQSPTQIVIKVSRSWIDDAGEIKTAEERYIVAVPAWSAADTTITLAR